MNDWKDNLKVFVIIVGGFAVGILLLLNLLASFLSDGDAVRQSAIEANVAEWQVDPKTGDTTFVWKKCQ